MLTRRGLIGTLLSSPAIIRPGILMPVRPVVLDDLPMLSHLLYADAEDSVLRALREQDAWRQAKLVAWARVHNFTRLPADTRWRTSLT